MASRDLMCPVKLSIFSSCHLRKITCYLSIQGGRYSSSPLYCRASDLLDNEFKPWEFFRHSGRIKRLMAFSQCVPGGRGRSRLKGCRVIFFLLVALGFRHHFTAFFTFRLKLNLLSAFQIKQAAFSVGVFFKVLLWWPNGIHAHHYREQNAENKTGKLSQGTRLKLAISRSQITSTSSMLAHSLARFWAPITALIFHISLSDRLLLPEGCWI